MFDCHYDLLTYILMKKENPDFLKNYCTKVYRKDNIIGGVNVNIKVYNYVKVKTL